MTDGAGTCFACIGLISYNRQYSRAEIEAKLKTYLGCEKLILVEPLSFEITKHIDIFAKLLDRNKILVGQYTPGDQNYDRLEQVAAQLAAATNLAGKPFKVIRIPMPPTYQAIDPYCGTVTVFPTYTNSTILNKKSVLVPSQPRLRQIPEKHANPRCCQLPIFPFLGIPTQVNPGIVVPVIEKCGPIVVPLVRQHDSQRVVTI
jgi:agmatine/peptidylarginine deiminase